MAFAELVQVHHQNVFLEARSASGQPPGGVQGHGASVEHQIVVATDLIAVEYGQAVLAGHVGKHAFAYGLLAQGEGRCGKVEDGVKALLDQGFHRVRRIAPGAPEILVVPDVFADGDPQALAAYLHQAGATAGLEITVLVEDIISGQKGLWQHGAQNAVGQQGRAVLNGLAVRAAGTGGRAHQQGRTVFELLGNAFQVRAGPCARKPGRAADPAADSP